MTTSIQLHTPDGTCVVSTSDDRTLRLWDSVSGVHLNILKGHSDWVHAAAFSQDGKRVMSASIHPTIKLFRLLAGCHAHSSRV